MLRRLSHWLLIVSLMLNSIGSAAAGVSMHLDARQAAHPAAPSGMVADLHAQHDGQPGVVSASASADQHGNCGDDCCGGADSCQCLCLCLHHAQALDLPLPHLPSLAGTGLVASLATLGIPAPPLGEDIRPPIR